MRSKSDYAWSMAAAKLAQQAERKDERDFFIRIRDSWIKVANGLAFLDVVNEHGTPTPLSPPRAGGYLPYPVSRSLERRRGPAARLVKRRQAWLAAVEAIVRQTEPRAVHG